MATRWFGPALLSLVVLFAGGAFAGEDKPFPKNDDPDAEPDKSGGARKRGAPDPCQMACSRETMSCMQACGPAHEGDPDKDPELKEKDKKKPNLKQSKQEKCNAKCALSQGKCLAECK